jgi:hypothetical protein
VEAGDLVLSTRGAFGATRYKLASIAGSVWRAEPVDWMLGGILTFSGGGFAFSSYRTWSLDFARLD